MQRWHTHRQQETYTTAWLCLQAAKEEPAGSDADSEGEGGEDGEHKLSKKKRKLEARLKIAELKQECPRPDVVEIWDVTAQDPKLLVYLKVSRLLS